MRRITPSSMSLLVFGHVRKQSNGVFSHWKDKGVTKLNLGMKGFFTMIVGTRVDPGFNSNSAPTSPNYWPFWQHLQSRCSLT